MNKIWNILFVAFATAAFTVACTKASELDVTKEEAPQKEQKEGQSQVAPVTITATIADDLDTKVHLECDGYDSKNRPTGMTLTWQDADALVVSNSDRSKSATFAYESGAGTKNATFVCNDPEALAALGSGPYNVDIAGSVYYNDQEQACDGATGQLKFLAGVENVANYTSVSFTDLSSVLAITAKMPTDPAYVAQYIRSVHIIASNNIFNESNELTITFADLGDTGNDGVLHFYATLPRGTKNVGGTSLVIHFNSESPGQTVYTRYIELPADKYFNAGKLNTINIDATNCASYANASTTNIGESTNPYLIGDKYQLLAVEGLMKAGETKYFKLIDDIDMTGVSWTKLNPDPFTKAINLDGNNKKVKKLNASLFDDLNGTVTNLTIEDATVSVGNVTTGILANTIKTAASTVTNVNVNGTVTSPYSSSVTALGYTGGLIGEIGVDNTSVTDCDVTNTNVSGTLAGGVIGYANALITMSGCNYSGGTVTASARYCGGMLASTANKNSVITDCHVENATITSSSDRAGGFAGLLHTNVRVKGCSVGTSSKKITINSTQTTATANVGGFVGVNYGTITKDGDDRCKAYVTVTSSNSTIGNSMQIGGFVGYNTGKIEYCDVDVNMASLKGQYIGGFCGILLQSGRIEHCTETGVVTGNNYTGGFVGAIDSGTTSVSYCISAGSVSAASSTGGFAGGCTGNNKLATLIGNSTSASVTSSGSNFGGFIGNGVGTFTSNYATGNVASTGGGNGGGFAGGIWDGSTGSVFSKNYSTGNVSGNANLGGFIGYIGGNITISDCYATGNVGNNTTNQKYGGLIGFTSDKSTNITEGVSITNCYATGDIEPSFAGGGLIGRIGLATTSVSKCAAWNAKVYPHSSGSANWSSGAVVGVAFPKCTLTDNYRNPSMNLTAYWVPADMTSFQHADVSSTHPLTDSTGAEMADTATASGQTHYPQYPYHGKVETGKTLSQLASTTLGWSGNIWDFSDDLPTLK